MTFSQRLPELHPNALSELLLRKRVAGRTIFDLTESNPTRVGLTYDTAVLKDAFSDSVASTYCPDPRGLLIAREAVCRAHGDRFAPADLFLTASTSEAYSLLFKLLCDAGENVLAPRPSYPLLEHLSRFESIETCTYDLRYDGRWDLDLASIEAALTPTTRAIVIVNPNNPTGSFVTRDELEWLSETCRAQIERTDRMCALIGDEVFSDYVFDRQAWHVSVCDQERALAFSLGGLSKSAGMPHLKLGWIRLSGPPDERAEAERRLEVLCDAYLSVNTPVQLATSALLEEGCRIREQIRARIDANRLTLQQAISTSSCCELLAADGGWYSVVLVRTISSEEQFVLDLLHLDDVLVHPGYFYDFEREGFLVLSLLPPPEVFHEGLARLLNRLSVEQ